MQWKGNIYIGACLLFELCSAPKPFNWAADLLAWVLQQQGVSFLLHYLDDFLTIASPTLDACQHNLDAIKCVCKTLGVPLAWKQVEGPAMVLSFFWIILDTSWFEAKLSEESSRDCNSLWLNGWERKELLNEKSCHWWDSCSMQPRYVVWGGRTFITYLYCTASRVKELHFYARLNALFRSDLWWQHTFLSSWNGIS